jgi:hypothetical protein
MRLNSPTEKSLYTSENFTELISEGNGVKHSASTVCNTSSIISDKDNIEKSVESLKQEFINRIELEKKQKLKEIESLDSLVNNVKSMSNKDFDWGYYPTLTISGEWTTLANNTELKITFATTDDIDRIAKFCKKDISRQELTKILTYNNWGFALLVENESIENESEKLVGCLVCAFLTTPENNLCYKIHMTTSEFHSSIQVLSLTIKPEYKEYNIQKSLLSLVMQIDLAWSNKSMNTGRNLVTGKEFVFKDRRVFTHNEFPAHPDNITGNSEHFYILIQTSDDETQTNKMLRQKGFNKIISLKNNHSIYKMQYNSYIE